MSTDTNFPSATSPVTAASVAVALTEEHRTKIADEETRIARYKRLIEEAEGKIKWLQTAPTNGKVSAFSKEERAAIVREVTALMEDGKISFGHAVTRYYAAHINDSKTDLLTENKIRDWKRKLDPPSPKNSISTTVSKKRGDVA